MADYRGLILGEAALVSYWRLGETSGSAADSKGTNTGTYTQGSAGGYTLGVAGALPLDPDLAVGFDSLTIKGYVDMGDPADGSLDFSGTAAFSVECWVRPTTDVSEVNVARYPISKMTASSQDGYLLEYFNRNVLFRRYKASAFDSCSAATVMQTNVWQHLVGTYDGTNLRVYYNGVLKGGPTASSKLLTNNTAQFTVGQLSAVGNPSIVNGVAGYVDEVAVYNAALSATAVAAHYAEAVAAREARQQVSNQALARAASY